MISALSGHVPGRQASASYREIDMDMRKEILDAID